MKKFFKYFGPAFLILALGIGSGEFILWPFLAANLGLGILWGALLGISLQLFLINTISRNTLILKKNILLSFSDVFPWAIFWILFSTIIGFGWPGFATLSSELLVKGFFLSESLFLPLGIILLVLSAGILVFAKSAYKRILFLEKIGMSLLFLLTIYLFIYYFDLKIFLEMIFGFLGIGNGYLFFPAEAAVGFLATFLAAIAYAGSGGNLLLANSFYIQEEYKKESKLNKISLKKIFQQNFVFFWGGGILIISMLSYISNAVLRGTNNLSDDFSFLLKEAEIFSRDISPIAGYSFIFFGAFAIFGVQMGIFDFLGRLAKVAKNSLPKWKDKISDHQAYSFFIFLIMTFGLLSLLFGFDKPKSLIITGAVINAFSMGVIALLLFFLEIKKIPQELKSKKVLFFSLISSIFYFLFFFYVFFSKVF